MDKKLNIEENDLRDVCRQYGVKRLSLYGSLARGEGRQDSDVDLLVEFDERATPSLGVLVRLEDELSNLSNRPVHLATASILRKPVQAPIYNAGR